MAGSIDDKVVAMSFENSKFESGVSRTLSSLEKLKQALHFPGASKGLNDISAAAGRVNLSHIGNAVDGIKSKFSALSVIGITALATLTSRAVSAGAALVKSLTLGPVVQGFHEYETQLNAVQTILSNTGAAGTKLKDVNGALAELNTYADKTIYNFSEMTRNIGTFTAAGVDLKTSVASIKGIANLAALSGSNSQQAATAMYQLSQAISAGRVGLQDWNSVVNAGMGGTIFQRALAQTAVQMGALDKSALKLTGSMKNVTINGKSFRESIMAAPGKQSWLTGKVLTQTLSQLSGNLSDAELKAKGYTDAQIKAIQTQAKQALAAATQVKTLSQLLDTTKEAIGSGWAQTWQLIFGDFGEAKTLFTGLSNSINTFVGNSANARNKVLKDWKELGGRTLLLQGLKQFFQDIGAVIKPVKDAFRDIFPPKTGQDLYNLTQRFEQFTEKIKPAPETIENLRRTFRGVFAVLDIGKQIVGGIGTVFKTMFGAITDGSGGFLDFTGNIGDFIVKIDQALKSGGKLHNFFVTLGTVLSKPLQFLSLVAGAIADLFSGFDPGGIVGVFSGISGSLSPMQKILTAVSKAWNNLIDSMGGSEKILRPLMQGFGDFFSGLGDFISNAIQNINWDAVLETIKVGLLGGLVLIFRNFFKGANIADLGGGFLGKITGPFEALTGTLKSMQTQVRAKALLEIAVAIGILAASVAVLSTIDPKKLNNALSALAIGFAELLGAMSLLNKIGANSGFLKVPFIAASLIILATAVGILVISVKALSSLSWNELVKGLTGVGTLLAGISLAAGPLSRNSAGLISAGAGITAIAIAMKVLASAVADFGGLSWTALAKGISSIAVSLGAIAIASKAFPTGMVAIGVGLIGVATGLKILASAVGQFGKMNIGTLAKGIGSVGAALVIMAGAMRLMPSGLAAQAGGLILIALALQGIARAVNSFGGMSLEKIAKGIGALGGSLAILAAGLRGMTGALAGAAALTVASVGLIALASAMKSLGSESWGQIIKGMVGLAGALGILGAAGILLAPVAPALMALGVALLAIGGGMALAGAGIALVGVGLSSIAIAGPTAIAILMKALDELISRVPQAVLAFAKALVGFVTAIGAAAPKMVSSFVAIMNSILQAVIQSSPKIAQAMTALLQAAITVIKNNFPQIVATGFQMLMSLLRGISNNIGRVTNMAIDIILKFLATVAGRMGQIVASGANLLVKFLNGIANNLGNVVTAAANVIVKFIGAIANNLYRVVTAAGQIPVKLAQGIGQNLTGLVTAAANAIIKFVTAVGANAWRVVKSAAELAAKFIAALVNGLLIIAGAIETSLQRAVNELPPIIQGIARQMTSLMGQIGVAIVTGILQGMGDIAGAIATKVKNAVTGLPGAAMKWIKGGSPALTFVPIGQSMVDGISLGITSTTPNLLQNMASMSNGVINAVKSIFGISSPSETMKALGTYIGQGFLEGIQGSSDQIKNAFQDLGNKLRDDITKTKDQIDRLEDSLKKLMSKKDKDQGAIKEAKNDLKLYRGELVGLNAALELFNGNLRLQKTYLLNQAVALDGVNQKLKDAQDKLKGLIDERDQMIKDLTSQFTNLPDIPEDSADPLGDYVSGLASAAGATQEYAGTLEKLRTLGMDDATYQKLLDMGLAGKKLADALLAAGPAAIANINNLDSQLKAAAGVMANDAGIAFKQVGIDIQQGVVDGFLRDRGRILREVRNFARALVKEMRKALKARSPSEEFASIGSDVIDGFVKGIDESMNSAVSSVNKMTSKIIDSINRVTDVSPMISPVLDLTGIQANAEEMNKILATKPVVAATSYGQAAAISLPGAEEPGTSTQPAAAIHFEQNNYSPEALSPVDIYRQTRNQLSLAKSALSLA